MRTAVTFLLVWLVSRPLLAEESPLLAEESWYRSPTLSVMTGYIYEPLKSYTIHEWQEGLGNKMDADRWVADFKEAGATYLVFYDKWIDGLVFHDTKTTGYKTKRDFVREVADACHDGDLKLVFYYNALNDGNPEFDQWALRDHSGNPIVFSPGWPTRYHTLHSPFRKFSVEQFRELMTNYGRVDGVWFDIFSERLNTSSKWTAQGFEKMFGVPFNQATGTQLAEFNARTLAGYLDEVRPIAEKHQPDCVFTANGACGAMLASGVWNKWVGPRLDYGSDEGHNFHANDRLARMAWVLGKPTDVALLLCSSWFTPTEDKAPPASMTEKQAIAAAAITLCQGAGLMMCLTPDHSGVFGEDLQRAKAIGRWFKDVEPVLKDARPYADVGIVLGTPADDGPGLTAGNTLWKTYQARQLSTIDQAFAVRDVLGRAGLFSRVLYESQQRGSWPESLAQFSTIILPERAPLDEKHIEQLRQYVKQGGRLIAFGHGSMIDAMGKPSDEYALADVFGVRYRGQVEFGKKANRTQVKVDSEYGQGYVAANLVDGQPTAWASGDTPMPHWAEIILAQPVDVAKVELVSRSGSYLVTDIDVEVPDGDGWRLVKSVRKATKQLISAPLDETITTDRIRVKILGELYQGQDRQYADVEAIRLLDATGYDHAANRPTTVPLKWASAKAKQTFGDIDVAIRPMALQVEPTTAKVLAELDTEDAHPIILRNRFGQGEAIMIATSEAALQENPAFWSGLRLALGGPTITCSQADRYRIILTQVDGKHVLHVIDQTTTTPDYQPAEVTISLDAERLGNPQDCTLCKGGQTARAIEVQRDGGRITFVLRPDPVASVVLQ